MDGLKQLEPGDLYLFLLSALMGHAGGFMAWKGMSQAGWILMILSAVLLAVSVSGLDDEPDEGEG